MNFIKLLPFLVIMTGCGKKSNSGTDATPKMSFDDVSVLEGNSGTGNVEIKFTLDHSSPKAVSFTCTTINGTAKSGEDFTAVNQTITFQPNELEKKLVINIVTDDLKEPDEVFQVHVENPVNVILLKGTVSVTLRNDDTKITFDNTGYDAPTSYPGYALAWNDEFNGTALDNTIWSAETGDGCPALCGWGNNELEYYTNPPNNVFFQDGKMVIEAKAETFGGKNYTSTKINTKGKKPFKLGRIDIRAILPKGKGIWPAFWLLPQDNVYGAWPKSGEIDMVEAMGSEPSKVLGTLHFGPGPNSTYISRNYSLPGGATFNDKFHVFSLEWKQDEIKWYIDNVLYTTISKADLGSNNYPFNESFYFIINLAVGGNFPGAPDATTVFPQWLIVDYIRVYQ